jgi:APA family basic amino acid/polyamine antiporter
MLVIVKYYIKHGNTSTGKMTGTGAVEGTVARGGRSDPPAGRFSAQASNEHEFSIFFCLFTGDSWVQYICAVSCVAAGLVYGIARIDAIVLRKKHPEWMRPYVAPVGNAVFGLGIVSSVWIVVGSLLEMPIGGYISFGIYILIGLAIYWGMERLHKQRPEEYSRITLTPDDVGKA